MAAEELSVSFKNSYKEISFQAPWGVIAAKAWGPEDGKPFLGLHGWLDNANTFDKLPENIRFVAIDFPGHGQSSHRWPGNMPYLHFEYVADTKKVVSQLGWKKFSIIGHSMGASVASLYAGSFPNEVENIILIDYGGPPLQNQYKPARVLARYATRMSEMKPRTPRAYESVEAAAARREEPYAGITLRKEDALLLTERGTRVIKEGVIFSHDQGLKAAIYPFVVPQSSLKLILSKIQCAVLVLEGTDSVRFSNEDRLARLSVTCQHAKFHVWKSVQGGHHFHLDNPEQTAQEIKQFLALCHDLCSSKL
ncbi:Serine hydrolase-like protein 2 [Desmophyllum pertusum]|uniref:Serine hydrolase-like protein 2 n=1 Tax=Desmophyllum pertusum TaxID=174260 RepID=A0A9X0D690_9CNID|nr:Serine hydrolase-like protein 2 [Desmophyllum pertusum]